MADPLPLFERVRKARIFQVLAVYLGASWVVLQIADVLQDAVGLPQWVSALAVLLLLIGLVIILATAWVQSLPSTTAREEAGEIPTDWQVAPAEAIESLKEGKLPHLTWGRAILGGVVALSLLFGGTGLYVGLTGRPGVLGPREVGADEAAVGIAVVPFSVTGGDELDLWREGMVDVLAANLDGMGGYRAIDSRTVMAQWRERVTGDESPDLRTALEVAAQTGARYALVGAMVGNPAGMRLSADLYDLSTGEKVTQVAKEGGADDVLALTSALSVDLVRELLGASGQDMVQDVRLGALTTTSLPALRAYLEAEAIYRTADFAGAVAAYERAVELDSLFALAWLRLSNSYGWLDDIASPAAGRAGERALALVDRLPARDRMLVRASEATRTGAIDLYEDVRDGVRNYPDDPDLWFELGEFIYHVSLARGVASLPQAIEAFTKAVELDPGFGPYQVHLLELTIADGDRAAAEAGLARYEESTTDARNIEEFSLAIPLLLGSDEEAAQAITASLDIDVGAVERVRIAFVNRQDRYDRISDLLWTHRNRAGVDHQWLYYNLGAEGLLDRVARLTDSLDITVTSKALGAGWMLGSWRTANGIPQLRELTIPRNCLEPVRDDQCQMFVGWGLARSGDLAGARESLRLVRAHAAEAEGAAAATRTAFADVIEGTIAMEEGRIADARRVLAPNARRGGNTGLFARIQLGELEWEAGNVSEAITYLTSNLNGYTRPLATYTLARLYEERGDTDQARRHYRNFVTATARGDEDLPEIVEAREALARLGG